MEKEVKLYLLSDDELEKMLIRTVIELLKRSGNKCAVAC